MKFATAPPEGLAFPERPISREKGARTLAREILAMDQAQYAAMFKSSAMKRAKLWMVQRNACVVLGNAGTADDLAVLKAMTSHEHALVREHAARAVHALSKATRVAETDG